MEKGSKEVPDLDLAAAMAAGEASLRALELRVWRCCGYQGYRIRMLRNMIL